MGCSWRQDRYQHRMRFYEDEKVERRAKPGDMILRDDYFFSGPLKERYKAIVPQLVIKENSKISRDFFQDIRSKFYYPLIRTSKANSARRMYNDFIDDNKHEWLGKQSFQFLEKARKPEVGDNLIKIELVRTRYKVDVVTYDGDMDTKGYFILPKDYEWPKELKKSFK